MSEPPGNAPVALDLADDGQQPGRQIAAQVAALSPRQAADLLRYLESLGALPGQAMAA